MRKLFSIIIISLITTALSAEVKRFKPLYSEGVDPGKSKNNGCWVLFDSIPENTAQYDKFSINVSFGVKVAPDIFLIRLAGKQSFGQDFKYSKDKGYGYTNFRNRLHDTKKTGLLLVSKKRQISWTYQEEDHAGVGENFRWVYTRRSVTIQLDKSGRPRSVTANYKSIAKDKYEKNVLSIVENNYDCRLKKHFGPSVLD